MSRLLARATERRLRLIAQQPDDLLDELRGFGVYPPHRGVAFPGVKAGRLVQLQGPAVLFPHGRMRGEKLVEQIARGGEFDHLAQLFGAAPYLALAKGELVPALVQGLRIVSAHQHAHPLLHLLLEGRLQGLRLDRLRDQRVVDPCHGREPAARGDEAIDAAGGDQRDTQHEYR